MRMPGTHADRAVVRNDGLVDEQITPILRTDDAETALAWYARLGFAKEWEHRFELGSRCSCRSRVGPCGSSCRSTRAMPAPTRWSI